MDPTDLGHGRMSDVAAQIWSAWDDLRDDDPYDLLARYATERRDLLRHVRRSVGRTPHHRRARQRGRRFRGARRATSREAAARPRLRRRTCARPRGGGRVTCVKCGRSPAEPRRDHGERVLCDRCASLPGEFPASIYADLDTDFASRAPARDAAATPSLPSAKAVPSPSSLVPSVTPAQETHEPEVEALLRQYAAGRLALPPVELPALPHNASPTMRRVAAFFVVVRGLRLYAGDDRPVPFACGWVGEKIGLPKKTAWRAVWALCEAGVLIEEGALPGRGKRGTKLYAPGPVKSEPVGIERRAEIAWKAGEPERHVIDEPLVVGAVVAVRDGALQHPGTGHATAVGAGGRR